MSSAICCLLCRTPWMELLGDPCAVALIDGGFHCSGISRPKEIFSCLLLLSRDAPSPSVGLTCGSDRGEYQGWWHLISALEVEQTSFRPFVLIYVD